MRLLTSTVMLALLATASPVAAQGWSFDARAIGLGGVGGARNIASKQVEEDRGYHVVVLPIGLIQVLRNVDVFKPDSDQFDLVRAMEYAGSPFHYVVGRDETSDSSRSLSQDIRNGTLSRDLNDYRGFVIASQPPFEGLAAPNFGGTIKVARGADGGYQGVYIGAGPYLAARGDATVDPRLTALLASETPVTLANASLPIDSGLRGEIALAITGGYRARLALPTSSSDRDGVYLAANYNYLRGLHYEDTSIAVRLDTDGNGLLTINPALPTPLSLGRDHATSGNGMAIDAGVAVVTGPWEAGFGATGLSNRITWTGVQRTTYTLGNLLAGGDIIEGPEVPVADTRVELPVDYRGNVGYHAMRWSVVADAGRGFQGGSFHGGGEYRFPAVAVRGGGFYTREQWQPTAGVGFPLGPRAGLDLAVYGTTGNAARERRAAFAASLRIGRRPE
ncbi:MAG TPA: hypothetical protein VL173_16855 [Vicinamibacterales bacterium]|nr:hypothetical protein [Vicinamibacterales bacterium]